MTLTDKMLDNVVNFDFQPGSYIALIDEFGNIIIDKGKRESKLDDILINKKSPIYNKVNGSYWEESQDKNTLIIFRKVNFQGWKLIMSVPIKEFERNVNKIRQVEIFTFVVCILLFSVIIVFLSKILTRRIDELRDKMLRVEQNDFNVVMEVEGNDEISELSHGFNMMVKSIKSLINEVYENKIAKKDAELRVLHEQINPHMLYNTLSSINWLAVEYNAPKITDMVTALASFYRLSLNQGKEMIRLEDEIKQVQAYIQIQRIRYEDAFEAYFDLDETVKDIKIIKQIIQPFIENSIKHGLDSERENSIYIVAKPVGEELIIRIIDNGKGMPQEKVKSITKIVESEEKKGYGIKNVIERIKLYYGTEYGIVVSSEERWGTIVEIRLPL